MRRDLIGETLLDQFRVEYFLASGGMATIYRVWDLQRSVPLAMKVLHPELAEDPAFMARFEREAQSLQMLVHPHIVPFYGLFRAEDLTFLLERYIDGPTLDEVLRWRAGKPMPLVEALIYFKALYTSLGYAHAQGIIHCDIKPGNVLIDQGGHVYLTDFGIARYMDAAITTSSAMGTPLYMAPEQIRGERLTPRADIYALGVVMFELLTGARPFRGDTGVPDGVGENQSDRIRYQQLYVAPPDPRSINPSIPEGLAKVVLKAMAKDPNDRYPSVSAMANEIAGVVAARFETLPDRVRLPEEMTPRGADWSAPLSPPGIQYPPVPEQKDWDDGGANPDGGANNDGGAVLGDTLPGMPPEARSLPPQPATQASGPGMPGGQGVPTRPRARFPGRLLALLALLALAVVCTLAGTRLVDAFRQNRGAGLPIGLPQPSRSGGTAPGANTPTSGKTPSKAPSQTHSGPTPTTAGLADFPISGEMAVVQRAGTDKLFLLNSASGELTALPTVPNVNVTVSNAPQWSPDGKRLTWISQYNSRLHVVVMDMTEREPYQLPAGEAYSRVGAPAFLPDGQHVSFWASGGGVSYLVTADATTGVETARTQLKTFRNMFVWNRQTSQLAFIQQGASNYKVAVSGAPDGDAQVIDTGGEGYAPAWSNDGQWLAFQSDLNRDPGMDEIWIAHPDGSELHAVTTTPAGKWSRAPSWSPDGKMIAFISNRADSLGNDFGELFVVDIASGKIRQVTNTGGKIYDWRPAWKP